MKIFRIVFLIAIGFLFVSCEDTNQTVVSYEDGITDICIDRQGNIWFGTTNFGIVFYDGSKWKNYRTSNSAIAHNFITSIDFDSKNNAWIATYGGLVKFDGKNFITINTTNTYFDQLKVSYVAVDKYDNVWAGTYGEGAWYYDGDTCINIMRYPGQEDDEFVKLANYITHITIDKEGSVWAITRGGLFKYSTDGSYSQYYTSDDFVLSDYSLNEIVFDNMNNLWLTGSYGLAYRKDDSWYTITETSKILPSDNVYSICIDSTDKKWIAMRSSGIASFNGTDWVFYNSSNSGLKSDEVTCIAADTKGLIWIALDGRQVCRFNPATGTWKTTDIYDF